MKGSPEMSQRSIDEISIAPTEIPLKSDSDMGFARAKHFAAQFEPTKLFLHADRIHDWLEGKMPIPITLELDLTLS
jgi:hypothetical protein